MASDADLDYLLPSFNPSSVTAPRLRSILVENDINYPSNAKKTQLVDIFNEQVAPRAKKILSARSRTKRSTKGIKDVPSSQEGTIADDDDLEEVIPPPSPAKRTSRRVTKAPSEDPMDGFTSFTPAIKATPKRVSLKPSRASSLDVDEQIPIKKSRQSVAPAIIQEEEFTPQPLRTEDIESPFTTDNPFQSGSSPASIDASANRERRRKTLGPFEHKERRKSESSRRKTEQYRQGNNNEHITTKVELPIARLKRDSLAEAAGLDSGEEFTPEEQLDLVRERAENGEHDVMPPRRVRAVKKSSGVTKAAPLTVLLAMLGGLATVWRQEKIEVGYCGVGRPSLALAGVEIPEWADAIRPQCEPCPPHAFCYSNLETACEPDFILTPHPLSFGGLVPLPPTCEPDSEKARRVKAVADRVVEELRERKAKAECGELVNDEGKHIDDAGISEVELKETMSARRRKGMSEDEFEELWKGAIGEILERDEVVASSDTSRGTRSLSSTSLARISLSCAIRRSIRLTVARHIWKLVGVLFFLISAGYTRWTITYNAQTEVKAKQLASAALDRLALQASLHAQEPGTYPETWISMSQLRDDILRSEFSASRRQKIWEKVQKKVEQNSNIRPMVREGRTGDVSRVWEWVGAVGALEDGGGSSRRQSSRYSYGSALDNTPVRAGSGSSIKQEGGGTKEMRHWDDRSRPMY